jgi:hypothetical protein
LGNIPSLRRSKAGKVKTFGFVHPSGTAMHSQNSHEKRKPIEMSHFFVPTCSVVDTKIKWKNGTGAHESHSTVHINQLTFSWRRFHDHQLEERQQRTNNSIDGAH